MKLLKFLKWLFYGIIKMILFFPLLAVFNENIEVIWVNFAALAYGCILMEIGDNTRIGRRITRELWND